MWRAELKDHRLDLLSSNSTSTDHGEAFGCTEATVHNSRIRTYTKLRMMMPQRPQMRRKDRTRSNSKAKVPYLEGRHHLLNGPRQNKGKKFLPNQNYISVI